MVHLRSLQVQALLTRRSPLVGQKMAPAAPVTSLTQLTAQTRHPHSTQLSVQRLIKGRRHCKESMASRQVVRSTRRLALLQLIVLLNAVVLAPLLGARHMTQQALSRLRLAEGFHLQ